MESPSNKFASRKFMLASGIISSCFIMLLCKRMPPNQCIQGVGSTFAIYTTGNVLKST